MKQQIPDIKFRNEESTLSFVMMSLKELLEQVELKGKYNAHRIDFYFIMFITQGEGVHEVDFKTYKYAKGDYLFIRKGQVHAWKEMNQTEGFVYLFTADFFYNHMLQYKDLSFTYPFNSLLQKPVVSTIREIDYKTSEALSSYIYQEFRMDESSVKSEILQSLLRTLLLKIRGLAEISKPHGSSESQDLFVKFHRMLEEKLTKSRNVVDYCECLEVSYDKLNAVCKELTNKTAKHYIDDVIILKAKSLLIDPQVNISQVAYSVGFEEPTNFTKFFRKHTNISPKEFQKNSISE